MSSSENRASVGSCQDCGNKSKKECEHLRCRTCCNNRGFVCPTHVKSTWVPLSNRRHKHHHHRLSLHLHTPNFPSSSGLGGGRNYQSLPTEISTVANFRRVRVNSGDNEVNEVAYQVSAIVGGHLFKGILYDQTSSSVLPGGGDSCLAYQLPGLGLLTEAAGVNDAYSGGYSNPNYQHHECSSSFNHASSTTFNASLMPHGMQFFPNSKP